MGSVPSSSHQWMLVVSCSCCYSQLPDPSEGVTWVWVGGKCQSCRVLRYKGIDQYRENSKKRLLKVIWASLVEGHTSRTGNE